MIGVFVPTLGRPRSLQRLVDNVAAVTVTPHEVVFVVEKHDAESRAAAEATGATVIENEYEPSYSNAIQTAYERVETPFLIAANDDFDFQPGWDTAALSAWQQPGISVVGIHDGYHGCRFSTISLVERNYIATQSGVIDIPGRVMYPYRHNYVDTEFFLTATKRGVFAAARESVILHRHPDFGHAVMDDTYRKSQTHIAEDAATFQSRLHLFS
jgi:glycosyltransferase involved in cell wall biosynthesis